MNVRFRVTLVAALTSVVGVARSQASSANYLMVVSEQSPHGAAENTQHRLVATFGSGVTAVRSASRSYGLRGGFPALLDIEPRDEPWLLGVRPLHVPPLTASKLVLHGSALHLGTGAGVKIAGRDATVSSRTRARIDTQLPRGLAPGYHTVQVKAGGKSAILPRGVGVLPMLALDAPVAVAQPFELIFRGTQGDVVVWFLSAARGPSIPVPRYLHLFQLDLASLVVLTAVAITDPNGEIRVPLPARPPVALHLQALAISRHPGYAPGSFTNSLSLTP